MKKTIFDNETFQVTCTGCEKEIRQKVRWFKGRDLKCPFCDSGINNEEFAARLNKCQKEFDDLMRSFKKIKF